jgi:double-strand break repair protein AddB
MIEGTAPRVFALPPGADYARALVAGLVARLAGAAPDDWARVTLVAGTGRMARRLQAALEEGPARLMPRIVRVEAPLEIDRRVPPPPGPTLRSALDMQLDLAELIDRLRTRQPGLAPGGNLFDLARALAALIEEMGGEGVPAEALAALDVGPHAEHWQRAQAIVAAAQAHLFPEGGAPAGPEASRRRAVTALVEAWRSNPPSDPVIVAGSTGSRATTRLLMGAVARLPQGAVVLPGVDDSAVAGHWQEIEALGEDHPQFRLRKVLHDLDLTPGDLRPWVAGTAPDAARNALVSLALCPAPVTDRWREDGPRLGDPLVATAGLSLIEAPDPRREAGAIALCLREAAEEGRPCALVTPDRTLARQVAAALARWGIVADDSAGIPLQQTAPGRFLLQVAQTLERAPSAADLLALLKHPLSTSGGDRGAHLLATRDFELWHRRRGSGPPDAGLLARFATARPRHAGWAAWLSDTLFDAPLRGNAALADHLAAHLARAEALAAGPGGRAPGALWQEAAGAEAQAQMAALDAAAEGRPAALAPRAYGELLRGHLAAASAQDPRVAHPLVAIWGTLEARAQGADLLVLGGLNEGVWPALPAPDMWLNRVLRAEAGLLSPEREVGLAAHDFQQAIGAPRVVLSRARRDAEAGTVPSRWLNRLTNLLDGLGEAGRQAHRAMQARGQRWLDMAGALDRPAARVDPAPRPAPSPPVAARPRDLTVTAVRTLVRDPYAVYARQVLRLRRLQGLTPALDAAARGQVLHEVMDRFLKAHADWRGDAERARAALDAAAADALADVADPAIRALWRARLAAAADRLVAGEMERLAGAAPVLLEEEGRLEIDAPPFALRARPDRIDRLAGGGYAVIDYKSSPPSKRQVETFDRQLALEAAMLERGAFPGLPPGPVHALRYVALGPGKEDMDVPLEQDGRPAAEVALGDLRRLVAAYEDRGRGYIARRAVESDGFEGDYDHLARFGEWEGAATSTLLRVGPDEDSAT